MEGSSENLDDGELWLPSDIFPVEEVFSVSFPVNDKFKNSNPTSSRCCYSCLHHRNDHRSSFMAEQEEAAADDENIIQHFAAADDENIIQRFAAISLLQQRPHNTHTVPKLFPITERFRPAERCSCTDYSLSECFERNRVGRELLRTGPPPVYQYQLYPLVQHQVESLMEARARVLRIQEKNQFIRMHNLRRNPGLDQYAGNRFSPFGYGVGGGANGESSYGRDYGGTGVFLPRISTTNINNKQGSRNRQDVQQTGERYPCI